MGGTYKKKNSFPSCTSLRQKHPIGLPKCKTSELIISHVHQKTYHGGTQLMLRVLRENYWILNARNLVKNHIHKCIKCVREKATVGEQFMANLPQERIRISRPFEHCGIDYAGPLLVRNSAGRGNKSHKAYIAIFVCFTTRAIHIELVNDYSSNTFIAALERFCARRGLPSTLYSDNGTTFVGAERELRESFKKIIKDENVINFLSGDSIE